VKTKDVFWSFVFGLIGVLVLWQLYSVLAALAHVVLLSSGSVYTKGAFHGLVFVLSFLIIVAGFVMGVYACNKKTLFYAIFRPIKQNIFLALMVSLLLMSFLYVSFGSYWHKGFIFFSIKVLIYAVIFYPFSALSLFIINKKKALTKYPFILIIAIILLSPPALQYASNLNKALYHSAKNKPCGAYVYGFMENAPAQEAGMKIGEVIKEINGREIKSLHDIKEITYRLKDSRELIVITDKGFYKIKTVFDSVKGKQRIGTNVWQQVCGKDGIRYTHGKNKKYLWKK